MTRLRGPLPLALLALFGVLLGLCILEIGARAFGVREERRQGRIDRDFANFRTPAPGAVVSLGQIIRKSDNPRIVYELRPRLDVIFAGGRVTTSDAGFRGRDVARPKAKGVFRIVGIGDSYMFGQGVADDATYLTQIPNLLSEAFPQRTVETVNLAVPGFNTAMEVEMLAARIDGLAPDAILIEIVGNDLDLPNFLWTAVDPWTAKRLFLVDFIRNRLGPSPSSRDEAPGLAEAPSEFRASSETFSRDAEHVPVQYASLVGLGAFDRGIRQLTALGRKHGVPVLALTHGVWFEEAMLKTLAENEIPILVLRTALRQRARSLGAPDYARSPLARSPTDLHPSELGHRAIAEELANWLRAQFAHQ